MIEVFGVGIQLNTHRRREASTVGGVSRRKEEDGDCISLQYHQTKFKRSYFQLSDMTCAVLFLLL